jgi:hypothetical protein
MKKIYAAGEMTAKTEYILERLTGKRKKPRRQPPKPTLAHVPGVPPSGAYAVARPIRRRKTDE